MDQRDIERFFSEADARHESERRVLGLTLALLEFVDLLAANPETKARHAYSALRGLLAAIRQAVEEGRFAAPVVRSAVKVAEVQLMSIANRFPQQIVENRAISDRLDMITTVLSAPEA